MFTQNNTQRNWLICVVSLVLLSLGSVACEKDSDVVEEDEQQTRQSTSKRRGGKSGQKRGASRKRSAKSADTHCSKAVCKQQGATEKDAPEQPENGHKATTTTAPIDAMITANQVTVKRDTSANDMMHGQDGNGIQTVQPEASHSFSIRLKPEVHENRRHNFVLIELIYPIGMQLPNFSVTASLSDKNGIVSGSSGKQGTHFLYNKILNQCNLEDLFLQDVKKKDDSLTGYKAISFRIKVQPSAAIEPGEEYILAIEIRYTGDQSGTHTAIKQVSLKAQSKIPSQKHIKRTNPKQQITKNQLSRCKA